MKWDEARPILEAAYRLMDEDDEEGTSAEAVVAILGRSPGDARTTRILARLYEVGYITGPTIDDSPVPISINPTEKGLQEVAGWPSPNSGGREVELLLALLDERISDESRNEDERGRLRRFREAAAGVGRDVGSEVLGAYLARISGAG
jgi:hypothetical protein